MKRKKIKELKEMDEIKTLLAKEAIRDQIYVYCRALEEDLLIICWSSTDI